MSEENTQGNTEANGLSDVEKLQAKNGEIIGKNKELKESNANLMGKLESMESTLKSLGSLVGVQEGEDITQKAQELIKAKEQETFDKMSDNERLSHRITQLEEVAQASTLAKEKAEKEALGLRIDERLKSTLQAQGVKDPTKLDTGLTLLKTTNTIQGIEGDSLLLDNGSKSITEVAQGLLSTHKFLIDNPSSSGSGFNGGSVVDSSALNFQESLKNKDFASAISQVLNNQNS